MHANTTLIKGSSLNFPFFSKIFNSLSNYFLLSHKNGKSRPDPILQIVVQNWRLSVKICKISEKKPMKGIISVRDEVLEVT